MVGFWRGRPMRRYALRDDQWERIKDFLPGPEGHVGGTAADNRLFVEAVLYRYRAGIPWRDLPERLRSPHRSCQRPGNSGERSVGGMVRSRALVVFMFMINSRLVTC